jgi:GH15 family glucan-1,4-alpha-glucosidase
MTSRPEQEPIESYALLGDMHTAALVSRKGSIDWLCFPRFDSPACFAALLGSDDNGAWRLAPAGAGDCTRRRYRGETMILETEWETSGGAVRVIDFMPPRGKAPDVVRIVEGVSGEVEMETTLRVRFDYGSIVPWVRRIGDGIRMIAGPDSLCLRSPVDLEPDGRSHRARFTVRAGERLPFVLTWQASHLQPARPVDAEHALRDTETEWTEWVAHCHYDGEWRDAVIRSLAVLKALTYRPTGGIVAAATTSLPEAIGGERNWDYRFCWLRDATMTLQALLYAGCTEEAKAWREWLLRAVAGSAKDMQIMYGIAGERRLTEYTVPWLAGYEGSTPVRIGNEASGQFQLDVYGELLDALHLDRVSGLSTTDEAWDLQKVVLDELEGRWAAPDQSLWEMRGDPRHFVHSKVMAWVGFDRAVIATERFGLDGPVERWKAARDEIHAEVCAQGYDAERGTFTQSYGSSALDAATLLIPQVGFLPATDPRVVSTVETIARELTHDGFVLRYDTSQAADGLAGSEGAFLACTLWLADDLHLIGQAERARQTFERVLDLRNDVGLLSEEWDPKGRRQLGNTPQAFSHVPLVNTARALSTTGAKVGRVSRREPRHHRHQDVDRLSP